jgi:hypothetical protein
MPEPARERGLMSLDISQRPPLLLFTEVRLAELRMMMTDRRLADPKKTSMSARNSASDPLPETEAARA